MYEAVSTDDAGPELYSISAAEDALGLYLVEVLVNGVKERGVTYASQHAGYARRYLLDREGNPIFVQDTEHAFGGYVAEEIICGDITLTWPAGSTRAEREHMQSYYGDAIAV